MKTTKKTFIFTHSIFIALSAMLLLCPAAANEIKNGGFEETVTPPASHWSVKPAFDAGWTLPEKVTLPAQWRLNNTLPPGMGKYDLVSANPKSGKICVFIKSDIMTQTEFKAREGDEIITTVWMRNATGEEDEDCTAGVRILAYGTADGKKRFVPTGEHQVKEDFPGPEWAQFTFVHTIPGPVDGVAIDSVVLALYSKNGAHYDDVSMVIKRSGQTSTEIQPAAEAAKTAHTDSKPETPKQSPVPESEGVRILMEEGFETWITEEKTPQHWKLGSKNQVPQLWVLDSRERNPGSISQVPNTEDSAFGKYSAELTGHIITPAFEKNAKMKIRVSLYAKSAGGSISIRLREYTTPAAAARNQIDYHMMLLKPAQTSPDWQEYSGEALVAPWHGANVVKVELVGNNVLIDNVRITAIDPAKEKIGSENVPRGILSIPFLKISPRIDGIASKNEWEDAAGCDNAFMDIGSRSLTERQSGIRVGTDGKQLFFLFTAPVPPGGLKAAVTKQDGPVYTDDSFEILINPRGPEQNVESVFQFVINSVSAVFDQIDRKNLGNYEVGWNCYDLKTQNRIDSGTWTCEIAIPLKEINLEPSKPFGIIIARNLSSPGQYTTLNGRGYKDYAQMITCTLDAASAAMRTRISGTEDGRLYIQTRIQNQTDKKNTYNVTLSMDRLSRVTNVSAALDPGASSLITLSAKEIKVLNEKMVITIFNKSGEPVFRQHAVYDSEKYRKESLEEKTSQNRVDYFPAQEKMYLCLKDFTLFKESGFGSAEVLIVQNDRTILQKKTDTHIQKDSEVYVPIEFKALKGSYIVTASVFNKDGKKVETVSGIIDTPDVPWLGNTLGKDRIVIPPFTPIVRKDHALTCWGRTYELGSSGFPSRILAQGEEVLSGPITLHYGNTPASGAKPVTYTETAGDRVAFTCESDFGDIRIQTKGLMEYDGMIRYELTVIPQPGKKTKELVLSVPYKNLKYFHWAAGCRTSITGWMMAQPAKGGFMNAPVWSPDFVYKGTRPFSHYFPAGNVLLWSSKDIKVLDIEGDFIPSIWGGNHTSGLTWFADSDEGWITDPESGRYEVTRTGNGEVLKIKIFNGSKQTLASPRKIVFAFTATPVRPRVHAGAQNVGNKIGIMGFGMPYLNQYPGLSFWDDHGMRLFKKNFNTKQSNVQIYLANDMIALNDPISLPMRRELAWEPYTVYTAAEGGHPYRLHRAELKDYFGLRACRLPSRTDFEMYQLDYNLKEGLIDGLYMDNSYPLACPNACHDKCGYIGDDGRKRSGFHLFETREFFKRLAVLCHTHKTMFPHSSVHMSSANTIGAFTFVPLIIDGEWDMADIDFQDYFTLPYIESFGAGAFGPNQGWLPKMHSNDPKKTRSMFVVLKLLDMWIWNAYCNTDLLNRFQKMENEFGIAADDCRFIGYFDKKCPVSVSVPGVHASVYTRPGKILVYIGNLHNEKKTAVISPAMPLLGWKNFTEKDLENKKITRDGNSLTIEIGERDIRCMVLTDEKK